MLNPAYLVSIGAIVQLAGALSYIRNIVRGTARPNKVTWLFWAIAPISAAAFAVMNGAEWEALPVFMSGFGPLLIFCTSCVYKRAYWAIERTDYLCGCCAALALVLWWTTNDPVLVIAFAIASDAIPIIPTIVKAWKFPESEHAGPFMAGLFSALLGFTAIQTWNVASVAFLAYLVFMNGSVLCTLLGRTALNKLQRSRITMKL